MIMLKTRSWHQVLIILPVFLILTQVLALAQVTNWGVDSTVRIGETSFPSRLAPYIAYQPWEVRLAKIRYAPLMFYDRAASVDGRVQLSPFLLADMPNRGNNGEFILEIKKEARWSDGTPITALDLAYSFGLLKSKAIKKHHHDIELSTIVGWPEVIGPHRLLIPPSEGQILRFPSQINIRPVKAPGDFTVNNIKRYKYDFTPFLVSPSAKHLFDALERLPTSTCFKFDRARSSTNEFNFSCVAGCWNGKHGNIKDVTVVVNPLPTALLEALRYSPEHPGRIDMLNEVHGDQSVGLLVDPRLTCSPVASNNFGALAFNLGSRNNGDLMRNDEFRKALALVLDIPAALETAGLTGEFRKARGPLAHSPIFPNIDRDLTDYFRPQLDPARRMMNALINMSRNGRLGFRLKRERDWSVMKKDEEPVVLTIAYPTGDYFGDVYEAMISQMANDVKQLGIQFEPRAYGKIDRWQEVIAESPRLSAARIKDTDLILGLFSYGRTHDFTWHFANRLAPFYEYNRQTWWDDIAVAIDELHTADVSDTGAWTRKLTEINRMIARNVPMIFFGNLRMSMWWRKRFDLGPDRMYPFDHIADWKCLR